MKKILSILLAAILILTFYTAVFADNEEELVLDEVGIVFHLPEAYRSSAGTLMPDAGLLGEGIYYAEIIYFAMPEDEFNSLLSKNELSQEEMDQLNAAIMYPFILIGLDDNRGIEELRAIFAGDLEDENVSVVYQEDDFSYFLYIDRGGCEQYASTLKEPFDGDFEAILSGIDELIENAEFYKPVSIYERVIGKKVSFSATDTEGNTATSDELFGSNTVTMVNIWASWCGPCIRELPELEAISKRLAEKNCGVVGLLYDGNEESALDAAKQIMADSGVTYPVILPPESVDVIFPLEAFPTTYFVDRNGTILSEPLVGAYVTMYENIVDEFLAAVK